MSSLNLNIGWLYPDLMSTYGDFGNIKALFYRARKRDIKVKIIKISLMDPGSLIIKTDFVFMGGAQDKQQEIVNKDLLKDKAFFLEKLLSSGVPGLFICGAYQFLGKYYRTADGKEIKGLGLFDLYTENPGEKKPRLIGNVIIKTRFFSEWVIGFENHGGRTYLKKKESAFARVIYGFGNNGQDRTEGMIWQNVVGTYLHGPILPKNPLLTDYFIKIALEKKYQRKFILKKLNDLIELKAREKIIKRLIKKLI